MADSKEILREMVRTLFRAENGPSTDVDSDHIPPPDNTSEGIQRVASGILGPEFIPIIRGTGQPDADREGTLKKIGDGSPLFIRHVDRAAIDVDLFLDNHVAIVRSLLPTTNLRTSPSVEASYRNMHVFLRGQKSWRCVAWQVTRVQ